MTKSSETTDHKDGPVVQVFIPSPLFVALAMMLYRIAGRMEADAGELSELAESVAMSDEEYVEISQLKGFSWLQAPEPGCSEATVKKPKKYVVPNRKQHS